MRMSKYFSSIPLLKSLYSAYVLSKLEYGSLIWSPIYACDCLSLDRVHRRFLKFISFKADGIYPDRGTPQIELLQRHGMDSLSDRRDSLHAKFVYKLVHDGIDCPFLLERLGFAVPRGNARYTSRFVMPFARTNIMKRAPTYTLCGVGNRRLDF